MKATQYKFGSNCVGAKCLPNSKWRSCLGGEADYRSPTSNPSRVVNLSGPDVKPLSTSPCYFLPSDF